MVALEGDWSMTTNYSQDLSSVQKLAPEVLHVIREGNADVKPNANLKAQHSHNNHFGATQTIQFKTKI